MSSDTHAKPLLLISSRPKWLLLNVSLLWRFRDLLWAFASRDITLRYRQTFLGIAWVVLQPLIGATVFAFIFGVVANMPSDGDTPYFVLSYTGFLCWTLFSGSLTRIANSLVANRSLITKIYFPRLLLPLSVIPCVLLDFVVGLALMAGVMIIYDIAPDIRLLVMPLSIAVVIALSLGLGIMLASLAVSYRDVLFVLPVVVQMLLFVSPVGYTAERIPEHLQTLYHLNPLAAPIEAFRWSFTGSGEPNWAYFGYSAAVALLSFIAALAIFRHAERKFADVI